ncbi:MAG: CDP-diacylglycerol--glycerol-3-phosphate 3-phosphatidyltransferase [Kineosporiaceae bacterium]
MTEPSARLSTAANAVTVVRILAVPVLLVILLAGDDPSPERRLVAAAVFLVAAATDRLDGVLARRSGTVTRFGVVADPLADKALLGGAFVAAALLGWLAWWVVAVVVAREVIVTVVRFAVIRRGLMPATRGGKLKTVLQVVAAAAVLVPLPEALGPAVLVVVLVMVAVTVVTGADIVVRGVRLPRPATS